MTGTKLKFCVNANSKALFSEQELKLIEYYKGNEFLKRKRDIENRNESRRRINLILNAMSKLDKKAFEKKFKNNFWVNFDVETDNILNKKIMLDLIMKDLYKEDIK